MNRIYNEIKGIPVLNAEEEKELFLLLKSSDSVVSKRARDRLIESNLRLVFDIALSHFKEVIPFDDLFSAGCEGLIVAVMRFDVDRGLKFSTFGASYISGYIKIFINKFMYGHLPGSIVKIINRMNEVNIRLTNLLGHEPSDLEMANALSISVEKFRIASSAMDGVISLSKNLSPLYHEVCDFFDDDKFYNDVFFSEDDVVTKEVDSRLFCSECYKIFDRLGFSDDRKETFKLKYGLDGKGERFYSEIASLYGVSSQAIVERIESGLERIRKDKKAMKFFKLYHYNNKNSSK